MGRKNNRKWKFDIRKEEKKQEGIDSPPSFSVNLQTPIIESGRYFLGYKLLRGNELWKWQTLEDVKF